MTEIIINGISIAELNKQRLAIKEDASRLMAERIETVKGLIESIIKTDDRPTAEKLAIDAEQLLIEVSNIHEASGVEYDIPYSDDWNSDGNASRIDDKMGEFDLTWRSESSLKDLLNILEGMESECRVRNTSTC